MKNEIFVFYIDRNIVISKQGGISTNGINSIIKIMLERVRIINSYYRFGKIFIMFFVFIGYLVKINNKIL